MIFGKYSPPNKFSKGLLVGFLSAAIIFTAIPVTAAVSDNLSGWLVSFLGYGEESNVPSSDEEFNSASLVEKVNYLKGNLKCESV